jgi:hypothetical protein
MLEQVEEEAIGKKAVKADDAEVPLHLYGTTGFLWPLISNSKICCAEWVQGYGVASL